ncbi:MAG: hypothetical protein IKX14_01650 [Neisseriaceae bacterium]|nr:hypothetical protein [Neisseriaceae bacterium]
MIDENAMAINERETQDMIKLVFEKTGMKIDPNDPMLSLFLYHRRYMEEFYSTQSELDNKNALEVHTALSPMIEDMKKTTAAIEDKHKELKQDIAKLHSFRDEMLVFFTGQAEKQTHQIVENEIRQQVSGSLDKLGDTVATSLKNLHAKNNYLLIGVFALQFISTLVLLFLAFKGMK